MKSIVLISVILLTTIELIANPSGLPQATSNSQLNQAFGAQQWQRTIQAVNQINGSTEPQPNSKLMLYKALRVHK